DHVAKAELLEPLRRAWSDSRQRTERESCHEAFFPPAADLHQAARLRVVRRELRNHPVRADADAAVEPRGSADVVPDALGGWQQRYGMQPLGAAEVEVCLVERRHDHDRRVALEHAANGARGLAVVLE